MLQAVAKGSKGFLIDGYPREVKQGEQFEKEVSDFSFCLCYQFFGKLIMRYTSETTYNKQIQFRSSTSNNVCCFIILHEIYFFMNKTYFLKNIRII